MPMNASAIWQQAIRHPPGNSSTRCGIVSKPFHPGKNFLGRPVSDQEFAAPGIHVYEPGLAAHTPSDQHRDAPDRPGPCNITRLSSHQKMPHLTHQPGADPTASLPGTDTRLRVRQRLCKFQHPPPVPERKRFH